MKKEEYSLVYKAIHGDSHAYGELIHQYNPYFYKIAFLYVKNEDAAVEIVQDSVYQGYLKIKTLRNPELFSTWMTRIIMNKAVRYIKQNKCLIYYYGYGKILLWRKICLQLIKMVFPIRRQGKSCGENICEIRLIVL